MDCSLSEISLEKGLPDQTDLLPRWPSLSRATISCLEFLRPSMWSSTRRRTKPLGRTAYLDGLRGFAALLVYQLHHELWSHQAYSGDHVLQNAFGFNKQYYFACLPFIRTFFSGGHFAVTVFFVISGYVLSAKPLSLIQAGESAQLTDNLVSALFRRWLRLFLPVICTTFLWMTSWHALGIDPPGDPRPQSTYAAEVWRWYTEFKNFSFVFKTEGELWLSYHFHAWSIPLEFRGSILIYTALLAFSKCTTKARLWCETGLIFYFLYIVDGWFCALFASGMLLCDLDLLASRKELPWIFSMLRPRKGQIFYVLFALSLFLGGVPSDSSDLEVLRKSFGWQYLSILKPQAVFDYKWFYLFWASTLLIASLPRIPSVKAFFETTFCQYLGRISFAFYLVHGPVLWTLGDRLYAATGLLREGHSMRLQWWINLMPMPRVGPFGFEICYVVPHLVLLPVTFWLAEIVTKLFDEPSVRFTRWMYQITLESDEKVQPPLGATCLRQG